MTTVKDLRTSRPNTVPFRSLKVGQAYEDDSGNLCIKTSDSFDSGNNCMFFCARTNEWVSEYEYGDEMFTPLNIEINVLP